MPTTWTCSPLDSLQPEEHQLQQDPGQAQGELGGVLNRLFQLLLDPSCVPNQRKEYSKEDFMTE